MPSVVIVLWACCGCLHSIARPNADDEVGPRGPRPDDLTLTEGGTKWAVGPDTPILQRASFCQMLGREVSIEHQQFI